MKDRKRLSKELGIDKDVLFKKCEIGILNALLKEKRLEYNFTQAELSEHLGYSEKTIARWERGAKISEYAKEDICAYFGIEVYD